ncbi:MAG: hypothetical protein M3R05_06490 [Chloroflexota bacterium]|nr:hypothetical protein [Chloroflexota bacterium]
MLKRFVVLVAALGVIALTLSGLALTKPPDDTQVHPRPSGPSPDIAPAPTIRLGEVPYGKPGDPSPIGRGGRSELWFNDGAWWGVLLDAGSQTFRIFELDWANLAWVDTGIVVDDRPTARSDVLWDGTHLYVVSAAEKARASSGIRLSRFSYDLSQGGYVRDANFPVVLSEAGVSSLGLAEAASGELWIAYIDQNSLFVRHSLETDLVWGDPLILASSKTGGPIDAAAITGTGSGAALVWTETTSDVAHIGVHLDTQPDDAWSLTSVEVAGLSLGPDELAVIATETAPAPRIYAVLRTSLDALANRDRLAPQIVLIESALGGRSTAHLVSRVQDEQTEPIVLLDGERRTLYVASTSKSVTVGGISYTQSGLDTIAFPTGPGVAVLGGEGAAGIGGLTSSKQSISRETGIVLLTADSTHGTYRYALLGLGAASPPRPVASGPRTAQTLLHQTFNGLRPGDFPSGWQVAGGPQGVWSVASPFGTDRAGRLSAVPSVAVTACASFPTVTSDLLRVNGNFLANAVPLSEPRLVLMRGPGGEVASVRIRKGVFSYFNGATRINSTVAFAAGSWYSVEMSLHISSKTYDLRVAALGAASPLIQATGLAWRPSQAAALDRVCIENEGEPGLDLYLDDLRVAIDSDR